MIFWSILVYLYVGALIQYVTEYERARNNRPTLERHVSMIIWLLWPMVFVAGVYMIMRKL